MRVGAPVYVKNGEDDTHAAVSRSIEAYENWAEGGPLSACRTVPMGTAAHVLDISINHGAPLAPEQIVLIRADNGTWRGYTDALEIMPRVPVGAVLTVFISTQTHGDDRFCCGIVHKGPQRPVRWAVGIAVALHADRVSPKWVKRNGQPSATESLVL